MNRNSILSNISGCKRFMAGVFLMALALAFQGCIPMGRGPSPRTLRKNPELKRQDMRVVLPDSLLKREYLLEFPYRDIREIKLSWKLVAGLKLKGREIRDLRDMIQKNVRQYWQFRHPNANIEKISLENMSVLDAQILLANGFPLLLYSAYDLRHRGNEFTFEGFDICIGYRGISQPSHKRVSFKLNSGLRGYIDSEKMLTGSLLDVPRLKHSRVQVLQVVLMLPPGKGLEYVHDLLKQTYKRLRVTDYTLPVLDERHPIGSVR